jgi:hypothetical protein
VFLVYGLIHLEVLKGEVVVELVEHRLIPVGEHRHFLEQSHVLLLYNLVVLREQFVE